MSTPAKIDSSREQAAFALIFFAAAVAMRATGSIGEEAFVTLATADLWAYMLGTTGVVLGKGWVANIAAKAKAGAA